MKNAFHFISKPLFTLKIFKFFSQIFPTGYVERRLETAKLNFKIHDITDRKTNNYNIYIGQFLKK